MAFREAWEGGVALHCPGLAVALGQGSHWKGISDRILLNFWERKASPCRDLCGSLSLSLSGLFVLSLPVIILFTYHPTLPIKKWQQWGGPTESLFRHPSHNNQLQLPVTRTMISENQWSLHKLVKRSIRRGDGLSLLWYIVSTRSHMLRRPCTYGTWSFESQIGSVGVKST